jgi:type VI secretion system protein ImpG
MDELLPYYEHELALLRQSVHAFATRYPKIAARLSMSEGHVDDPHVDRLLQTFALLGARISAKLDDDYPEFTEALLDTLDPEELRPFPSCSIAQFDAGSAVSQLTETVTVPRGTELENRMGTCRFRTAYEVALSPIAINGARFTPIAATAARASVPPNTTAIVSVTFTSLTDAGAFRTAVPATLRVHLHGDTLLVAALNDALLLRTPLAFVESDFSGRWQALSRVPLTPVGFDDEDALVGQERTRLSMYRLIGEYLGFPDKFAFLDIDFARLARVAGDCRNLTLHLPIVDVPVDSSAGRALGTLSADHWRLRCTPVVNLFRREASPVTLKRGTATYPVIPQALRLREVEVHSVDSVRLTRETTADAAAGTAIPPYRAFNHGHAALPPPCFWLLRQQARRQTRATHSRAEMTLVDAKGAHVSEASGQLIIGLTCSNGDYPQSLSFGAADGDLLNENDNLSGRVTMLRRASPSQAHAPGGGALWRLVSGLAPHTLLLRSAGVEALKDLLRLQAANTAYPQPHIDAIVDIGHRPVMRWMAVKPMSTFVRGIEITLTINESACVSFSLHTFGSILERFFASSAPENGFVQLAIRAAESGRELLRYPIRPGAAAII